MDDRGGCYCSARNATKGGFACHFHGVSNMDQIMMLKFRPIAPKPTVSGSSAGKSSPEVPSKTTRRRRRCVRQAGDDNSVTRKRRRGCGNEGRKGSSTTTTSNEDKKFTSMLLESDIGKQVHDLPNRWINFSDRNVDHTLNNKVKPDESVNQTATAAASRVIVECMTDTWVVWDGLGRTDKEKITNLESDMCPGFVSNMLGLVTWTNEAMKKMLDQEAGGHGGPVVSLLAGEAIPDTLAFTCRVRVESVGRNGENKYMVVPCDAWRMHCGGYAWRLDVEAALRLGR